MYRSIRGIALVFVVTTALTVSLSSIGLAIYQFRAEVRKDAEQQAHRDGALLLRMVERYWESDNNILREEIGFLSLDPTIRDVLVVAPDQSVQFALHERTLHRPIEEVLSPTDYQLFQSAYLKREDSTWYRENSFPEIIYVVGFQLPAINGGLRDVRQGGIYIRYDLSGEYTSGMMSTLTYRHPDVIVMVSITLFGYWLVRNRLAGALESLTEATRKTATGSMASVKIEDGPREIHQLALAFNKMNEQIVQQFHALADAAQHNRTVVDSLYEAVVVTDKAGIITLFNKVAESMFGLPANDALGRPLISLLQNTTLDSLLSGDQIQIRTALRGAQSSYLGSEFLIEVQLSKGSHHGNPVFVVAMRDITERERIKAELDQYRHHLERLVEQRTAELEQARVTADMANQAKSAFLATISHEIRTPMNGVLGMTEVLEQGQLRQEQLEMVRIIRASAVSLLSLINDILDFSKIEAGKLDLSPSPFSLRAELEKVAVMFGPVASQKRVSLSIRVDDNVPNGFSADVLRLHQILNNLVSNAIKFSSDLSRPGKVSLHVTALEQGESECRLQLRVCDNGIGMDSATLQKLFRPFEQADASTTRRYGGSGLGLAITRQLIERMGGTISVESTPDKQTCFTVEFSLSKVELPDPAPMPAPAVGPDAQTSSSSKDKRKILVVEDNEINQQVILYQLSLLGFAADVTGNGLLAIEAMEKETYALILADLHMPIMDGYQFTRAIRTQEKLESSPPVPILALTAAAVVGERERCMEAGMNGYLNKPISLQELKSALHTYLPGVEKKVVDSSVLQRIVGNNLRLTQKLLRDFLAGAQGAQKDIKEALADKNYVKIGFLTHRLKSSARTVGAMDLGELCESIEKLVRTNQLEEVFGYVHRFDDELIQVEKEILAFLSHEA